MWPDSRLAAALGASVGTELNIGARTFRVSRILITRPDQGATFLELAPSLIMNEDDLDVHATRAARQPHATRPAVRRVRATKSRRSRTWLEANKKQNEEIEDVEDSAPQIKSAIDRSARFLSIASLVAVLLCAIAVAMAARRYVHRHLDSVALLKTLGATRGFTLTVSLVQLTMVGLLAAMLGSLLGFGAQAWLVKALAGLLRGDLPPPGLAPLGIGFLTAIAVLGGFALPPLLQLSRTPALRVLRRDVGPPQPLVVLAFGPAVIAIAFLIYWVLRDQRTAIVFVVGLSAFVVVVALAGWLLVRLTTRFRGGVGRVLAIRHRQPRPAAHRERGAAHGVRARHHDAAVARGGAQRPAQRLAAQPARRHAELLLHQHSAGRTPGSSPRSSKSAARSTRGRGRWSVRA